MAELEDGVLRQCGRGDLVCDKVLAFARTLRADDEVVLEATGNTMAIVKLLKPHVGRVVIANPLQVRVIAEAKTKPDRIDAAALTRLHAAGYLPEVWQPDEATDLLRNLVSRRASIVQEMTQPGCMPTTVGTRMGMATSMARARSPYCSCLALYFGGLGMGQMAEVHTHHDDQDPHLRNVAEVDGYHVNASDGDIGPVEDLVVEDDSWGIRYLIVDTELVGRAASLRSARASGQPADAARHHARQDHGKPALPCSP